MNLPYRAVTPQEFIRLAFMEGWGPNRTAVNLWLSKNFGSSVRIGNELLRVVRPEVFESGWRSRVDTNQWPA